MERLTSDALVPPPLRGAVLALGNFDGFHRGHQAVVARSRAIAEEQGRPLVVATFDPHPIRVFRPDIRPFLLTTLDQRERLFAAAGAEAMLVFRFDETLRRTSAEDFIDDWLIARVGAAVVVTGEDFTFGADRSGSVALLAERGPTRGLATHSVRPVEADGDVVSSSRIRRAVREGEPGIAAELLTRPFTIRGVVSHGDKRGRTIGYPTANLDLGPYIRPAYGVYAVRVALPDGRRVDGAANIGVRPMFEPPRELLEAYLFDWSGDLYGQEIEVELVARLRPEAVFDGLDALVAQMDADCAEARRILSAAAR